MSRKEELLKYLGDKVNREFVEPLVDEVVFLEQQLSELKQYPFIKVHPTMPELQKATPASRLYVSLMAQYNANIRTLAHLSGSTEVEEDSPLRAWARKNADTRA